MVNQDNEICFELLKKTSRSFNLVIQNLPEQLKHAVGIFYLVLRALDTIEDDTTIPIEQRKSIITTFYSKLKDDTFTIEGFSIEGKHVLSNFPSISREYSKLENTSQEIISNVCRQMSEGMSKYMDRGVDSLEEWDDYCFYVAGLVGQGLSSLFITISNESEKVMEKRYWNSMGLFLQKTNIIRDFAEDLTENRAFWPKEVWGKHTDELANLQKSTESGLIVLNKLIRNALSHIPDVLTYLSFIKCPRVFAFCAIPQIMAMATLELCYNNPRVLVENVKIPRYETYSIARSVTDYNSARALMYKYAKKFINKGVDDDDFVCWVNDQCKPPIQYRVEFANVTPVYLFVIFIFGLLYW